MLALTLTLTLTLTLPLTRCARLGPALFDPVEQTAQLVAAYGQNIFLDGVFGADPHPGNLQP